MHEDCQPVKCCTDVYFNSKELSMHIWMTASFLSFHSNLRLLKLVGWVEFPIINPISFFFFRLSQNLWKWGKCVLVVFLICISHFFAILYFSYKINTEYNFCVFSILWKKKRLWKLDRRENYWIYGYHIYLLRKMEVKLFITHG